MCGFARHVIGCMICLVVIGPVLIIVGIVMLMGQNTREEDISQYNAAVDSYDAYKPAVAAWTGTAYQATTISIANFSSTTRAVTVSGNNDGVNSATSTLQVGTLTSYKSSGSLTYKTDFETFTRSFPFTKSQNKSIACSKASCSSYCSDSDDRECDDNTLLTNECQRNYNSGAAFTRTEKHCKGSETCGYCTFSSYATRMCAVVDVDNEHVSKASTTKSSCLYPFGVSDHEYSATTPTYASLTAVYMSSVSIELRSSNDPFIVLQEITDGSNDFGLTRDQQTSTGFACLFIGIFITICLCGLLFYAFRNNNEQQNGGAAVTATSGVIVQQDQQPQPGYSQAQSPLSPGYPQAQSVYPVDQQQQAYGQPQPAYGQQPQQGYPQVQPLYPAPQQQPGVYPPVDQQQQGYGQPQPGSGQPQTGSGQPQPGSGQPQPAYGQQPQQGYPQAQPVYPAPQQQPGYIDQTKSATTAATREDSLE